MRNLCWLDETRCDVLGFDARNRDQRAVRKSLLEKLDLVERYDCRPGQEEAFERSWTRIEQMYAHLLSPELAWRPSWISRAFWEAWMWLWGASYRVREWCWRLRDWRRGVRERWRTIWWGIRGRFD